MRSLLLYFLCAQTFWTMVCPPAHAEEDNWDHYFPDQGSYQKMDVQGAFGMGDIAAEVFNMFLLADTPKGEFAFTPKQYLAAAARDQAEKQAIAAVLTSGTVAQAQEAARQWWEAADAKLTRLQDAIDTSLVKPTSPEFAAYLETNFDRYIVFANSNPGNPGNPLSALFKSAIDKYLAGYDFANLNTRRAIIADFQKLVQSELVAQSTNMNRLAGLYNSLKDGELAKRTKAIMDSADGAMIANAKGKFLRQALPGEVIMAVFFADLGLRIGIGVNGRDPGYLPVLNGLLFVKTELWETIAESPHRHR